MMGEKITFDGKEYDMDDIENIFIGEDFSKNPIEPLICVQFKDGTFKVYAYTVENAKSYQIWVAAKCNERLRMVMSMPQPRSTSTFQKT